MVLRTIGWHLARRRMRLGHAIQGQASRASAGQSSDRLAASDPPVGRTAAKVGHVMTAGDLSRTRHRGEEVAGWWPRPDGSRRCQWQIPAPESTTEPLTARNCQLYVASEPSVRNRTP